MNVNKQYTRQEKIKALGWLTIQLLPLILVIGGYFLLHGLYSNNPEAKMLLPIADLAFALVIVAWLIRVLFSMINQKAQLFILAAMFPIPGLGLIGLALGHFLAGNTKD